MVTGVDVMMDVTGSQMTVVFESERNQCHSSVAILFVVDRRCGPQ